MNSPSLPDPQTFQSGDLIWPKKPGYYVPYNSGGPPQFDKEKLIWQEDHKEFLARERIQSTGSQLSIKQLEVLGNLDFREFYARYVGDQKPDVPGVYATGRGIYVGHVGIIEIRKSIPWVIEAIWNKGVIEGSYEDWLNGRPGEVVWHGRLRDVALDERTKVASEACRHVGKPYKFWNFDLLDESGFYCSKLVWLSIMNTLGFAVDGNPRAKRGFWFSPKQLLHSSLIEKLNDPGSYAKI